MATPHASASMAALRRNGLTVWPGMTIFGIGDLAHPVEAGKLPESCECGQPFDQAKAQVVL